MKHHIPMLSMLNPKLPFFPQNCPLLFQHCVIFLQKLPCHLGTDRHFQVRTGVCFGTEPVSVLQDFFDTVLERRTLLIQLWGDFYPSTWRCQEDWTQPPRPEEVTTGSIHFSLLSMSLSPHLSVKSAVLALSYPVGGPSWPSWTCSL